MAFLPNSKVRLYKNVPLDISNDNQLWFDNISEQNTYFANVPQMLATILEVNYIEESWLLDLQFNKEQLRDVNYIAFQNSDYSSHWVYAFVTDTIYISPNVSSIKFVVDDFQTYLFDINFKPSYVEREHVSNDTIGANIIDEGIGYGDYTNVNKHDIGLGVLTSYNYVIASTRSLTDPSIQGFGGNVYNGVYSGIDLYGYDNADDLKKALSSFKEWQDSIYSIYMAPKFISTFDTATHLIEKSLSARSKISDIYSIPNNIDGYTPKNKKLFTYPYNLMTFMNNTGQETVLRYEMFNDINDIQFKIEGVLNQGVQCCCYPLSYKGLGINREYQLMQSPNPSCLYVNDVYSTWLTQNNATNTTQALGSIGMIALGAMSANPFVIGGGVLGVTSLLANREKMSAIPDSVQGSQGGNYVMSGANDNTFILCQKTITSEYARTIDDYFTRYGYKVDRLKLPNFHSRKSWNFIKTAEFNLIGKCNTNAIKNIKDMFNRGITLWHTSDVGNFALDNSII